MTDSNRVILIGLDGLGRAEIGEWIDDGTLETLHSLSEAGTETVLESTHPPWTPCAWPSLLSGRNPGEHGVFDFFTREENSYGKRLIDRTDVQAPYLFEAADSRGLTSLVVNFPVTHPAADLEHGAVVPGYLAPETVAFSPPELRAEYEAEYGPYRLYPQYDAGDDAVEEYTEVARCRRDMARYLDATYDWDLLATQFQVTDSVFHDLDDREEIRTVLETIDSYVGEIVSLSPEATVFVASDHGMGDYDWTFYANAWLADHGYCRTTAGDATYFRQAKSELRDGEGKSDGKGTLARAVSGVADVLASIGLAPDRVHRGLSSVGLASAVERLVPEEVLLAAQRRTVDWANSNAYQLYYNSLGVQINLEGREPAGMVGEGEYEAFRERLMDDLRDVTDPDGNDVFAAVKPRETVYEGRCVERAPDIVLVPREYRYDVSGSIANPFRRNPHKNHKPEGILVTNVELSEDVASIYDIAPTVATCLGMPVDTDTDGRVLLADENTEEERIGTGPEPWRDLVGSRHTGRTDQSGGDVEQRLADLGYME